ncbi:MAG: hypothetical protein K5770_10105 [Lachnospiraceae bacterium]|nr:hypothetical protein [Lachnospiraceae bacterium]
MPEVLLGEFYGGIPLLVGIFDGMGGEECGEVASLIASECAAKLTVGTDRVETLLSFCEEANR